MTPWFPMMTYLVVAALWARPAHAQSVSEALSTPYDVRLADDLAARQIISGLQHALDSGDYERYGSFFADDGVFESDFGDAVGPAAVAAALQQVRPMITGRRHVAANLIIRSDGRKRLVVRSYLVVFERMKAMDFVGSAVNVDTMEKRGGKWKIVRHASTLDPATGDSIRRMMGGDRE